MPDKPRKADERDAELEAVREEKEHSKQQAQQLLEALQKSQSLVEDLTELSGYRKQIIAEYRRQLAEAEAQLEEASDAGQLNEAGAEG